MPEPWHYTTVVDFLDHWQSLVAGVIALLAASLAVGVTLKIEQRKVDREINYLRKSLAIELRQLVPRALGAHNSLKKLVEKTDGPITARMVERVARVPAPIVYPAIVDRIGLLENEAMDVVITYSLIDNGRGGVALLIQDRTPDNISRINIVALAAAFLDACKYAQGVLPRLRTGIPLHDDRDDIFIRQITDAILAWDKSTSVATAEHRWK
jgi:hypothetical protein